MVNPYNLRNPRRANVYISAAGPLSNIFAALGAAVFFLILKNLGLFSVVPFIVFKIFLYLVVINIYLAIFNLIPVPPLDGSGILEGVLKGEALVYYEKIKPYGILILLLIIYTGVLHIIAEPIILFVLRILA